MAMALSGVRILDLSRYAPGFYVSMYLGDMGADVIKIEEPAATGRRTGFKEEPLDYKSMEDQRGSAYNSLERNKRKVALNLKDNEAKEVFFKLVQTADVILEGSRPGVADRLGIDYKSCANINPRIIYCSLTGYGQGGPYRLMAGHDINYISMAGALGAIGQQDGRPAIPVNLLADYAGGAMNAIIGVLLAIIARQQTGKGQFVDVAMTDGVVSLMVQLAQTYFSSGEVPEPGKMRLNGGNHHYNVYEAKDGRWISIGSNEPWFFSKVCELLGRPDYAASQHDPEKRQEIGAFMSARFRTKTADEWHAIMSEQDTCVTKVKTLDEVFVDPQVIQREMVLELDHPSIGRVRQV